MLDVLVIGGGQAGLAAAFRLREAGLHFRVLDAESRIGGSWPHYYDSLTLFSPAAYSALPGLAFPGAADRYPRRDEVVQYLESYVRRFDLPVELGRRVHRVTRDTDGFVVEADGESIRSRTVISATGAFSHPHRSEFPGIEGFQGQVLHSRDYRSPAGFEGRRIVVVGGANSAVQIAAELAEVADVTLASRRPIRFVPQRLLGRDFHFWLAVTGLDRTRWLDDQSTPVLDDGRYRAALASGRPARRPMFERVTADGVQWRGGETSRADVLLLATGYRADTTCLDPMQPLDARGKPAHRDGASTRVPGLFYLGLPKQRNFASATLRGVGNDARVVVDGIRRHLRDTGFNASSRPSAATSP